MPIDVEDWVGLQEIDVDMSILEAIKENSTHSTKENIKPSQEVVSMKEDKISTYVTSNNSVPISCTTNIVAPLSTTSNVVVAQQNNKTENVILAATPNKMVKTGEEWIPPLVPLNETQTGNSKSTDPLSNKSPAINKVSPLSLNKATMKKMSVPFNKEGSTLLNKIPVLIHKGAILLNKMQVSLNKEGSVPLNKKLVLLNKSLIPLNKNNPALLKQEPMQFCKEVQVSSNKTPVPLNNVPVLLKNTSVALNLVPVNTSVALNKLLVPLNKETPELQEVLTPLSNRMPVLSKKMPVILNKDAPVLLNLENPVTLNKVLEPLKIETSVSLNANTTVPLKTVPLNKNATTPLKNVPILLSKNMLGLLKNTLVKPPGSVDQTTQKATSTIDPSKPLNINLCFLKDKLNNAMTMQSNQVITAITPKPAPELKLPKLVRISNENQQIIKEVSHSKIVPYNKIVDSTTNSNSSSQQTDNITQEVSLIKEEVNDVEMQEVAPVPSVYLNEDFDNRIQKASLEINKKIDVEFVEVIGKPDNKIQGEIFFKENTEINNAELPEPPFSVVISNSDSDEMDNIEENVTSAINGLPIDEHFNNLLESLRCRSFPAIMPLNSIKCEENMLPVSPIPDYEYLDSDNVIGTIPHDAYPGDALPHGAFPVHGFPIGGFTCGAFPDGKFPVNAPQINPISDEVNSSGLMLDPPIKIGIDNDGRGKGNFIFVSVPHCIFQHHKRFY